MEEEVFSLNLRSFRTRLAQGAAETVATDIGTRVNRTDVTTTFRYVSQKRKKQEIFLFDKYVYIYCPKLILESLIQGNCPTLNFIFKTSSKIVYFIHFFLLYSLSFDLKFRIHTKRFTKFNFLK